MSKVLIIQRSIPHYRIAFFTELNSQLKNIGIDFKLVYSVDTGAADPFQNKEIYSWATRVNRYSLQIGARRLSLQLFNPFKLHDFDLIIFEQANENLFNFIAFSLRPLYRYKIAFWGHGRNRQSDKRFSLSETLKRHSLGWADWWFAYTNETTRYLVGHNIPQAQITTVNNSIDTAGFIAHLSSIDAQSIAQKKQALGIESNNIALFCGSMYAKRGIDFLLAAADEIRIQIPDFHLVLAGSGDGARIVEDARKTRNWLHYLGPVFDREKALAFSISKMVVMPGIVGLVVIDALVSGLPLITTKSNQHGPEIDYIQHGNNGFITEPVLKGFVSQVVELFHNSNLLADMRSNCVQSRHTFSTQAMAKNFVTGIALCLAQK